MANAKPQIKELDCTTGEEIVRDATAQEIIEIESRVAKSDAIEAKEKENNAAKKALLAKLGITAKEAALLLS